VDCGFVLTEREAEVRAEITHRLRVGRRGARDAFALPVLRPVLRQGTGETAKPLPN
jgi:hypothetical protein